jgi:hypothetical protein
LRIIQPIDVSTSSRRGGMHTSVAGLPQLRLSAARAGVRMPTAHHRKTVDTMEERSTGQEGHRLLAGNCVFAVQN